MAGHERLHRPGYLGAPGLAPGPNEYPRVGDSSGIGFALLRLDAGARHEPSTMGRELAVLVIRGRGTIRAGNEPLRYERGSWIEASPTVLHVPAGTGIEVRADAPSELALVAVENPERFEPRGYLPADVRSERRGEGRLDGACTRIVRTVFDRENAPVASRLVLGEVVALPGRWSSYPPHHHEQPEIYYYRFEPEQGFGYAGLGDEVLRVRQHDLVEIPGGLDHPQVAAPGYTMYYLWAVRHLPGRPYTGFEFAAEHAWLWK